MGLAGVSRSGQLGAGKFGRGKLGNAFSQFTSGRTASPLRATNNADFLGTSWHTFGSSQLQHKSRQARWIGAGARSDLVISFTNFIMSPAGVVLATSGYTIQECYLENEAETLSVQVLFGGAATRVVAAGDTDINSDPIYPSAFSLGSFALGSKWWIRARISVASNGDTLPLSMPYNQFVPRGGTFPSWLGWAYDPAVNTTTGAISGTGTISLGTGVGDDTHCPTIVLLGRFVSGDPMTWTCLGDSTADASTDTLTGNGYAGQFSRALINDAFNGGYGAGIGMAASGAKAQMWTGGSNVTKATAYWKYTKGAVESFGANHFNIGAGAGDSLVTIQGVVQSLWTMLRAQGITEILRLTVRSRTTSTDLWATLANQTPISADYDTGGLAEQFNTWLSTQISGTAISAVLPLTTSRHPSDDWSWPVTGAANYATPDGIHPSSAIHALEATALRAAMALYP